jgi:hypothetical protein
MYKLVRNLSMLVIVCLVVSPAPSQETSSKVDTTERKSSDAKADYLKKMLDNVALVGMFSVDSKPMSELKEERYEITKIDKLPDEDLWALESRIKYGNNDVVVPIVVTFKWADQTPVIVMDQVFIPGLGTFSARVVFHDGKYAGTWIHGEKGGHLFGRIEPLAKKQ